MGIWERFRQSVRRSFWRGVATLLPALLTIVVIVYGLMFLHNTVGQYINRGIIWLHQRMSGWEQKAVEDLYGRLPWSLVGTVVAIIGFAVLAYFLAGFIGVRLWRGVERIIQRVPVVRQIYAPAKQITEFMFSDKKLEFSRVVAVEYPRKGVYSLAFVTGRGFETLDEHTGAEYITVFIPNSPWPVTGFTVCVRKEEIVDLPITVDEALRFVISGGVIGPHRSVGAVFPADEAASGPPALKDAGKTAEGEQNS